MGKIDYNTKIITVASQHNFENDRRELIPFIQGSLIGFINKDREIIIPAKFEIVLDDFEGSNPLIRVGRYASITKESSSGNVSTYKHRYYGLMNKKGELVLPMDYEGIAKPDFTGEYVYTVRSLQKGYAVFNNGEFIVPFKKYDYIDGYQSGFARIKIGSSGGLNHKNDKWGIIDEFGNIILTPEYSNIDKFYLKGCEYSIVEKDGIKQEFHLPDGVLKYDGFYDDEMMRLQKEMDNYDSLQEYRASQDYFDDTYMKDSWDAMTDGMYGDMPDGFDGDFDFR